MTVHNIPGIAEPKCNCPGDYYGWNGNTDDHNDWCPMSRNYVGRTVDNKPGIAEEIRKALSGAIDYRDYDVLSWLRSLLEERDKQKELEHTLCLTIEAADKTIQQLREELKHANRIALSATADNERLRSELEQVKKERDGWRQEAKREREKSERIVEEREEAIIEVERLCSQLAAKDKTNKEIEDLTLRTDILPQVALNRIHHLSSSIRREGMVKTAERN